MAAAQTARSKAGAKKQQPKPQHALIQALFIAVCVGILVNIMIFMIIRADEAARGKHHKAALAAAADSSN